jgi:hypothetical protein
VDHIEQGDAPGADEDKNVVGRPHRVVTVRQFVSISIVLALLAIPLYYGYYYTSTDAAAAAAAAAVTAAQAAATSLTVLLVNSMDMRYNMLKTVSPFTSQLYTLVRS